tara:strand:- start:439 stop:606 length:168 start_codon:yes stop_codon:yes gene_type:complete
MMKVIDLIVKEILPHYSDEELTQLLKRRPNKNSILHKAVLKVMGERCATQYEKDN